MCFHFQGNVRMLGCLMGLNQKSAEHAPPFAPTGFDDRHGGRRLFASRSPYFLPQGIVNLLPNPFVSPLPEDSVDRAPLWKVSGKHPPLAARANHVQDGIDHPTSANRLPASTMAFWQQLSNHLPLPIRQITGIIRFTFHRYGSFLGSSQKTES